MKNERGVVYLEMLIGFLPVFMFFLGTLQVADMSVAHLVVEHAATTAARAAVVVLPDDGAYYEDEDNAVVDEFRDYRQSDVERAADTILAANPRLDLSFSNVALEKPKYSEREVVSARVTAPYHCLVPVFCPGGITISAQAQLIYQGAHYVYEPSTGWASNAANHGLSNLKKKIAEYREKKKQERDDGTTEPDDKAKDDDTTKPDDDADKLDPATQKKLDDLKQALPKKQQDIPIKIDPDLPGSTVQVHYTHDDKGRITGIEIHVGPDAKPRHIQDHVATIRTLQRYQGVAGKARALVQRFSSWLTGHPNAGPGTLAWETKREVDKLNGILETRQRQLEDPNLTKAQRTELENELNDYEKQLAEHEKTLKEITDEPARGFIAAGSRDTAANLPPALRAQLGKDLTPEQLDHVTGELSASLVSKLATGRNPMSAAELKSLADQAAAARKAGVEGVDDWVKFESKQDADHARKSAAELSEAQRIAQQNPNLRVEVGGDENAPMRPSAPTDPSQSFDIQVTDPATGKVRHVEVTTASATSKNAKQAGGKITSSSELTAGVQHAGDKVASRARDGLPLTGSKEVAIQVDLYSGAIATSDGGTVTYDGNGNYVQQPPHPSAPPRPGNIFDDFQKALPGIRNSENLDTVRLTDSAGNLVAEFERTGDTWTRVH